MYQEKVQQKFTATYAFFLRICFEISYLWFEKIKKKKIHRQVASVQLILGKPHELARFTVRIVFENLTIHM